jgi:hypothetical protein
LSNVLITLDIGDGIERPYEFSARTTNMYEVAGFKFVICKREKNDSFEEIMGFTQLCVLQKINALLLKATGENTNFLIRLVDY